MVDVNKKQVVRQGEGHNTDVEECDLQIDAGPLRRWERGMEACGQSVYFGELIRVWRRESFRLELYDTGRTDRHGKARLAYCFSDSRMSGQPIFVGADFFAGLLDASDSDATLASLLWFLSLGTGDTDPEYFDDYTQTQLDWRDRFAEELGLLCSEMQEAIEQACEEGGQDAIFIDLSDDGTLDTVFAVFDCMLGEQWEERFSDLERNESGLTAGALAFVRELVEEAARDRREEPS